ncbi:MULTISPECIES: helix-turn-helix domain-containing protein [Acaryochloris]|uniref:helix-turn-helix domain-containing protein n=1 Tax=Acaryochloris TaxID=155977 RepID=UPI00345144D7
MKRKQMICRLAILIAEYNTSHAAESGFRKLTIKSLSDKTGIARTTLTRLDRGVVYRIDSSTVVGLCDFFGCALADLLTLQETEVSD